MAAIEDIAKRKGSTAAQIALAWLLAQKPWIVPIPGTTKLHRVEENLGAAEIIFGARELKDIEVVFAGIEVRGDRYSQAWAARVGR